MLKTNILTPVLSGVLAVTVAGSGVLYALDKKDKNDSSDNGGNGNTVAEKMTDKISAAAETVEKAFKGELNYGYTGNVEFELGSAVTKNLGYELAPFALTAESKQKGGKSETDLTVSYDNKSLATVYLIADADTNTYYLKCPELNDAYLSLDPDELETLASQYGINASSLSSLKTLNLPTGALSGTQAQPDLSGITDMLKDIDVKALEKDFEEYIQVVKDAIPEGETKDNIEGDINGHTYSYEVKTVDVTLKTVTDVINAVADKAKNDDVLKEQLTKLGMDASQYDTMIQSLTSAYTSIPEAQLNTKLLSADLYTYNGEYVGFDIYLSGYGDFKLVSINNDDVFAIDLSGTLSGSTFGLKGAFENNDDALNGSLDFTANGGESVDVAASLKITDLKTVGDNFSGSVDFNFKSDGTDVSASIASASTEDVLDVSASATVNGEKAGSVKITGEKTEASDVTLPSGTIYKLDKEGMTAYEQSADVDGFLNHIKEVLGNELGEKMLSGYNSLKSGATTAE